MHCIKTTLSLSAGLIALIGLPPAFAQSSDPQTASENQESENQESNAIIVTARRQDELLAEVPASVTVFTAESLERSGVQQADEFVQLTAGVTIVSGTAEAGDTQINIRGINGARDAESSVALVVDGILKTNTAQLNQDQGTLRQVEILKGPQGALYGRNAAAGAIVIQTLKPSDAFEAGLKVALAEDNSYKASAYVSVPVGNSAGFLLSGSYDTSDGFYRNSFLDNQKVVDDQKIWSIDGRFVANLGDATEVDLKTRYANLSGASINFNAAFHLPNFAAANPAFFENVNEHSFNYYSNIRPTNNQKTFESSIRVTHDMNFATLTAWALYSDVDQALTADGTSADFARYTFPSTNPASIAASASCFSTTADLTGFAVNQPGSIGATPVPFIFAPATGSTFGPYSPTTCDGTQFQIREQTDISTEIRLASNHNGPLGWQIGAYFLNIDRTVGISLGADLGQGVIQKLLNDADSNNPTSQLFADNFNTNVYAAFGSLDYEVADNFDIGVALRYDIEDRKVSNQVPLATDPITAAPINPGQAFGPIPNQKATFKQLQPKVSLRYAIGDDVNFYANWGVGFKSGGFNNQGAAAIVDQNFNQFIGTNVLINDIFRKEKSSAFEAGIKGSLLNASLTFDLAGYYTDVDDMQFFEFFVGAFGLLRVVSNIDEVELYGAEFNANAEIVKGWNIFGSVNVTESKIKANSSRPDTVGNKSPYTADYTINIGTQIVAPIADSFDIVMRADYRITGPTWFHSMQNNTTPTLFSGLLPGSALALPAFVGDADYAITQREAFAVLDLRLGFEGENWTITAFADNLLDRKYLNEVIPAIEFGGSFLSPGRRRRFGVEASYKF